MNSRTIQKSVCLLGALAIMISSIACGSSAAPDMPGLSTAVPAKESAELVLFMGGTAGEQDKVLAPVLEGFTRQNPGITIKIEHFNAWPHDQIAQLVKDGKPPDLMFADDVFITYVVDHDLMLNMREFIAADMQFKVSDIREAAMQGGMVFGKPDPYAMPMTLDTTALVYNKAMFRKAGLPDPKPEWTWDDLIAMCKRIQETNPSVTCLGWANGSFVQYWYPWVRGYGGDVLNADHTQATFSSPETTQALQHFTELWTKHHIAQSVDEGAIDCVETQKCAIDLVNANSISSLKGRYKFEYGFQSLPSGPKGRFTPLNVGLIGIIKGTQHGEQAWKFVKYLLSPEVQSGMVGSGQAIPVLKSMQVNAPDLEVFTRDLDTAQRVPVFPATCGNYYFGDLQSVTQNVINNTIKGFVKLEDALKQADSRMNACLVVK
jgi:multiple sugar transport system substrate-binding protein